MIQEQKEYDEFIKFLNDRVDEKSRNRILSLWKQIQDKAGDKPIYLPVVYPSYEDGPWSFCWNKKDFYISIDLFHDESNGYFWFWRDRKKDTCKGGEFESIIPDDVLLMIINWKPSKEEGDE